MKEMGGMEVMSGIDTRPSDKPLLRALAGETLDRPPWWLMRQAGRYLQEYRAVRAKAGDFITLCLAPDMAAEVTLQPVRRFGMDAAILFSDILLVARALGQSLSFEHDGPKLKPVSDVGALRALDTAMLAPVAEAALRVRAGLPESTALIGFAGAPWTVATYMVEGGTSRDFQRVRAWSYRDPVGFNALIECIVEATFEFLALQIEGGAEAIQLFDSWAGALSPDGFERWVIAPTKRLVMALKAGYPQIPIIGFPRGAGIFYQHYAMATGIDAVSLDTAMPPAFARDRLQSRVTVQGNLDPVLLLTGGAEMHRAVDEMRTTLGNGPYIFNLGHGILPETPPEHVAELANLLAEPLR